MSTRATNDKVRRAVLASLGCLCVGLGAVGIVVPGLPTTVFLLAASYLFARSSTRLQQRLLSHPWFGGYLRRFAEQRGMPARAKISALAMMWSGIGVSIVILASVGIVAQLALLLLGLSGTAVLLLCVRTVPSRVLSMR